MYFRLDAFFSLHLIALLISQFKFAQGKIKPDYQVCSYNVINNDLSNGNLQKYHLHNKYCFDIPLPYKAVTLPNYVPGRENLTSLEDVHNIMAISARLKYLPKCWPKYQKLFCSIFFPRIEEEYSTGRSRISRPNIEICNDVIKSGECDFISRHFGWHSIFRCNDTKLYATKCNNELDVGPTHMPETCQYPLVPSVNNGSWFKDIEGCSLHCKYPVLDLDHQEYLNIYLTLLVLCGFFGTVIALILFEIKKSNDKLATIKTYSIAEIIKKCNRCKFVEYCGWSLQIFFVTTCNSNGSSTNGFGCLLSFFLTYVSYTSYLIWLTYFSQVCYEKLTGEKRNFENSGKLNSLNKMSYLVPISLFIVIILLKQVDGHGVYGICTVKHELAVVKILFDLLPTLVGVTFADFYFFRTCFKLLPVVLKQETKNQPEHQTLYINFIRISAIAIFSTLDIILRVFIYSYISFESQKWEHSIDNYVACNLDIRQLYDPYVVPPESCTLGLNYIVIVLYYLELFTKLVPGYIIASWSLDGLNVKESHSKIDRYEYRDLVQIGEPTNGQASECDVEAQHQGLTGASSVNSTFLSQYLPNILDKRNSHQHLYQGPTARDVRNDIKRRNELHDLQNELNLNEQNCSLPQLAAPPFDLLNQDELLKEILPQLVAAAVQQNQQNQEEIQMVEEIIRKYMATSPDVYQSTSESSEPHFTLGVHTQL